MSYRIAYITAKDLPEAKKLVKDLLVQKLIACANINPNCLSMYWWEEQIMEDNEVQIVVKTRADLMDQLTERIKELHSYDNPCIVSYPIEGDNTFLNWLHEQTS